MEVTIEQTKRLQVNKLARKERHVRVFKKTALYRAKFLGSVSHMRKYFDKVCGIVCTPIPKAFSFVAERLSMTTTRRLSRHISITALSILVLTSVSPSNVSGAQAFELQVEGTYLISDQEGYLTKSNPVTLDGERGSMTDRVTHAVATGETVSEIAEKYGLKSETLLWENNIYNPNTIKIGQKLVIPPVNGVSHKVKSGETLEKIAAKYKVEKDLIVEQNQLDGDLLAKGQELFIPGGKSIQSPYYNARALPARTGTASRYISNSGLSGTSSAPAPGKIMIFPTRGKVTQGWRWGHYAIDIADVSKPPIWASTGGVVEKATSGWNGGYGNHVVIDHGNGLKTLYAHLEYYTVSPGQTVSQGQVIGKMGRTGRVYGRTGIHLHFEVIQNGVKQYPGNYW
jgi:murein DD-endopeptidase MepM/ murein hydrolase activator NlpD